jgi:hypothetical protein
VATNGVTTALTKITEDARTGRELSNAFSPEDRLFRDFTDWNTVYDTTNLTARDLSEMLSKDGNTKKLEQVLTLPIRGADWEIRGDGTEAGSSATRSARCSAA